MKIYLFYVYILTSRNHTILYTGVTNDLVRRTFEHKKKIIKGFTFKYNVDRLVYFEQFDFIDMAIAKEKQIKGYSRVKKIALINKLNPEWNDLYDNGKIILPTLPSGSQASGRDSSPRKEAGFGMTVFLSGRGGGRECRPEKYH